MGNYVNIIDGMTNGTDEDLLVFQGTHLLQKGVMTTTKYSTPLKVTATGTPDKNTNIAAGYCYVPDASSYDKIVSVLKDATEAVLHDNTTANPRYDAVVLFVDFSIVSDANGSNMASIEIVKGSEAASPAVVSDATITATLGAATWVRLADVLISFPFVSIVSGNITDTRPFAYIDTAKVGALTSTNARYFGPEKGSISYAYNSAGTKYTSMEHDGTNGVLTASSGQLNLNAITGSGRIILNSADGVTVAGGKTFRVFNTANTNAAELIHDGTNAILSVTSTGALFLGDSTTDVSINGSNLLIYRTGSANKTSLYTDAVDDFYISPNANGDKIVFARAIRDNNGSTTYQNVFKQSGWGYLQGDGTAQMAATITLPFAYSSANYRISATAAGYKASAPSSENEGTVSTTDTYFCMGTGNSTTLQIELAKHTGTFNNARYYIYHWFTEGPI